MPILFQIFFSVIGIIIGGYTLALVFLAPRRNATSNRADLDTMPTLSLLIPTFNEATIILRKLANVAELTYPHDKLQVVVVDSASTDGTSEIVKRFADEHWGELEIVLLRQPVRKGKSNAINEALDIVTSDIVVLTDADVTFPTDSLLKLVKRFDGPKIGAVSGVEVPIGKKSFLTALEADYRKVYTAIRIAEAEADTPFMCESELSAYRRQILEPLPVGSMCDDIELTVSIRRKGFRAVYETEAMFFEKEAGTLRAKLQHKMRRGMANQYSLLRNTRIMFNHRFGKYGTLIFPFEFFVHIISPIFVTLSALLLVALAFTSPIAALTAIVVTTLLSLPALSLLQLLIRRHRGTRVDTLQGTATWLTGAIAFIAFQGVLLISLIKLGLKGPQLNWQQIPNTRIPITVEAKS